MKIATRLVTLVALVAGCSSSTQNQKMCTEIGCADGLAINLSQALTSAGSYKVTVETPAGTSTCQAKLPFDGCSSVPACSSAEVLLIQEGCALPASQQSLSGLRITSGSPASVKLTIERDGKVVAAGAGAIAYTTSTPNGPDCAPVCKQASLAVPVTSP